jgi:hypothetical protein
MCKTTNQGNSNQNHNEISNNKCWQGSGEKGSVAIVGGNVN